jgi:MFS family permease
MEQRLSSIGQVSELLVMIGLGGMIARLGFKWTIALGALAYLLRCLIFAAVPALDAPFVVALPLVCLGLALHGFCFGCFWAVGFIYVDRMAPEHIRGTMQTFYGTFVFGSGMFFGGIISGLVGDQFSTAAGADTLRDWSAIWLICAGLAALSLAAFAAVFPAPRQEITAGSEEEQPAAAS